MVSGCGLLGNIGVVLGLRRVWWRKGERARRRRGKYARTETRSAEEILVSRLSPRGLGTLKETRSALKARKIRCCETRVERSLRSFALTALGALLRYYLGLADSA